MRRIVLPQDTCGLMTFAERLLAVLSKNCEVLGVTIGRLADRRAPDLCFIIVPRIMALSVGTRLGSHEITGLLGKGGMGEVYRARDLKLKRDVAIKILPEEFARDADRMARFQREAQILASLNHPNIAGIHELQEGNQSLYLVLELVQGETLADRIGRGPIAIGEALEIGRGICAALEAAHEKGIVHRDLKPANVKITSENDIKVLDFGLAKASKPESAPTTLSNSPTISMAATQQGVILGTAAYMSPEQAKGRTVDRRTDVWAYGCVLYEMLTGRQAFSGNDVADVLAAVLRTEPDWNALPADLNEGVREVLQGCFKKNPQERWRDIGDVSLQIDRSVEKNGGRDEASTSRVETSRRRRPIFTAVVLAACAGLLLAGVVAWAVWPLSQGLFPARLEVLLPPDVRPTGIAVSPDGKRLAFVANGRVYMRALADWQVLPIPGTEGAVEGAFFSPDGQWLAFFTSNQLKKIALDGSAAIPVANITSGLPGTWAPGDRIFYGIGGPSGLFQVSASGGMPELAAKLETYQDLDYPEVLPGGKWLLFSAQRNTSVSIQFEVVAQSLITGERKILVKGGKFAKYSPTGHLIYEQLGSLYAVAFDPDNAAVTGSPASLGEHVATDISFFSPALFTMAPNGTLAFVPARDASKRHLVWVDRSGRVEALTNLPQHAYAGPRISPDGQKMMVLLEDTGDLWIYDKRGSSIRLTNDGLTVRAIWSSDGSQITYSSGRVEPGSSVLQDTAQTRFSLFSRPSDGSGEAHPLAKGDSKLTDARTAQLANGGAISPDGKWAAYVSDESGRGEVYVTSYPGPAGKSPVSTGGGSQPVWGRNGELFYRNGTRMMAVPVSTSLTLKIGEPKLLFDGDYEFGPQGPRTNSNYDVTPDGQRFLMVAADDTVNSGQSVFRPQINVILNWARELQQRVPPR
jgi:eukaryotic-like serine/threonine-protein kinase